MNPIIILYHGHCTDGFTAAWVADRHFRNLGHSIIQVLPLEYQKPVPVDQGYVSGADVFVLDFWLPEPVLRNLAETANKITVLDHHATAQKEFDDLSGPLPDNVEVLLDMQNSGAAITWNYLCKDKPMPWLVGYVSDHDLHLHKLPDSQDVSAFIQNLVHDMYTWDLYGNSEIGSDLFNLVCEHGAVISQSSHVAALRAAESAYEKTISGLINFEARTMVAAVVNTGFPYIQKVLTALLEEFCYDLAISYTVLQNGVKISARSTDTSRISAQAICEALGGGGHRNAAGAFTHCIPQMLLPDS